MAGIVLFSYQMQSRNLNYESFDPGITRRQYYERASEAQSRQIVFNIFYPVHLLCVIYSMNTLLRRVSDHASHSYYNVVRDLNRHTATTDHEVGGLWSSAHKKFDCRDCIGQYALYYWVRSVHIIATVLCLLHLVVRIMVVGFRAELAVIYDQAAAFTDLNGRETNTSFSANEKGQRLEADGRINASSATARVVDATTLVFVASGFLLFFPAIIVMFRRVERKIYALMLEMDHRSDAGTAFLPVEFLPRAADGSVTQTEMPIVEVRQYLRDIETSAAVQRRRFVLCLVLVTAALLALALVSVFVASFVPNAKYNPDCGQCDRCQSVEYFISFWYINAFVPEVYPLVISLSSTLPLVFSLWLMTTPEDRMLLLHPDRFLTERITLQPVQTEREENLYAERFRMGINLQ